MHTTAPLQTGSWWFKISKSRKWLWRKFANFLFSLLSKIFANRCDLASSACRLGEIQEIRFLHSFKYLNKISHLDIHWHNFANLKDNIKNPFRKFLRHKILANVGEEFSSWVWLLKFWYSDIASLKIYIFWAIILKLDQNE